jgi:hypothetical protein
MKVKWDTGRVRSCTCRLFRQGVNNSPKGADLVEAKVQSLCEARKVSNPSVYLTDALHASLCLRVGDF